MQAQAGAANSAQSTGQTAGSSSTTTVQGKAKATLTKKQTKVGQSVKSSVASGSTPAEASTKPTAKKTRRKKESAEITHKSKSSDAGGEDPVGKIRLKTVIRRLPPNVPEAVFWKAISPWVVRPSAMLTEQSKDITDDLKANIDYGYFVQGKLKDSSRRRVSADAGHSSHVFSRAYLHFTTIEALVAFHRGFDGHLFKDAKGHEYVAIVEFAPFQRTPLDLVKKRKADQKQGTIEDDSDYQTFLTSLEKKKAEDDGQTQAEKTDAQLMSQLMTARSASTKQSSAKHTPLLDHLRAQHTARAESSALKNARNHLNRSNNAYAASKGGPNVATSAEKRKAKAKGQMSNVDIPSGPKASKKKEAKIKANKASTAGDKMESGGGSNLSITTIPADSATSPANVKPPKGPKGAKGQNKGIEPSNDNVSILAKQGNDGPNSVSIPTGPSADRGASRGRSRPPRAGNRGGGGGGRGGKASRGGGISSTPGLPT